MSIFIQLVCHFIGDYILQSDWMATNKTKSYVICLLHSLFYSIPFYLCMNEKKWLALFIIMITHFIIDKTSFAKYICYLKNLLAPKKHMVKWKDSFLGYATDRPIFITFWLYVIVDNLLHVLINYLSLSYL